MLFYIPLLLRWCCTGVAPTLVSSLALSSYVTWPFSIMNRLLRTPQIQFSPIRLHSVSTIHLRPNNYDIFSRRLSVSLPRTQLHSTTSVFPPNSTALFNNIPFVRLAPSNTYTLKKHNIQRSLTSHLNSGHNLNSISKCNRKRCCACKYLSCKSVVKSTTNGRNFSINIPFNAN